LASWYSVNRYQLWGLSLLQQLLEPLLNLHGYGLPAIELLEGKPQLARRRKGENAPILPPHHQDGGCERGALDAQQDAPSLYERAPPEARTKDPVVHLIEHRGSRHILGRRYQLLRQCHPHFSA
jgi:hypothetical protein